MLEAPGVFDGIPSGVSFMIKINTSFSVWIGLNSFPSPVSEK